jgi:hypothetical protein
MSRASPVRRKLLLGVVLLLVVAIVGTLATAILLIHPALLLFIGGALVPAAMPFMMKHPQRGFLTWASGTVTVAAIAPIVTGGLFDPNRPVHTEPRSWAIALGAAFFGYGVALVCPWLGERIAVARHRLSEIKFDRRRAELIEIWTEQRLRKPASQRPQIGKDFVSEEEETPAETADAAPPPAPAQPAESIPPAAT